MRVVRAGTSASVPWQEHLTGAGWMELLLQENTEDPEAAVTVTTATFTPGSRSHWHRHTAGQLLLVVAGEGWLAERDSDAQAIRVGDVVWTGAGIDHWHGATDDSVLVHLAVTLGSTHWYDEPADLT